jgi:hypothetical protein
MKRMLDRFYGHLNNYAQWLNLSVHDLYSMEVTEIKTIIMQPLLACICTVPDLMETVHTCTWDSLLCIQNTVFSKPWFSISCIHSCERTNVPLNSVYEVHSQKCFTVKLYRLDISTSITSIAKTVYNACWHIPHLYMPQAFEVTPQCNKTQPHQLRMRTENWAVRLVPAYCNGTQCDHGYNSLTSATLLNWLMVYRTSLLQMTSRMCL